MTSTAGVSALAPGARDASSAGHLLGLVRRGAARSRTDLVALTGASRSTVALRVDALLRAGLLTEGGLGGSTGGRPPRLLTFSPGAGCVVAAELGVSGADVAVTDLSGAVLGEEFVELLVADGPGPVLGALEGVALALLQRAGRGADDVRAVGLGIPGPVEFATGRPVHPPVMPGWHDHPVPRSLPRLTAGRPDVPVVVDNDVNVIAAGELDTRAHPEDFLVVKVGTGIGCGIVAGGRVYRGSAGSAGDIGHILVPDAGPVPCRCGNTGCLEAVAGGIALTRRAQEAGLPVSSHHDVVALAASHDPAAVSLVRAAGRDIGGVLAGLVNFVNPSRIVVTGSVAVAGNALLAGIREAVYARSLPLAARSLDIAVTTLPRHAGRHGAARLAIEAHLDPARVDRALGSS